MKKTLLIKFALILGTCLAMAVEDPLVLVCKQRPGNGAPDGNGLLDHFDTGGNGLQVTTWGRDSYNLDVSFEWNSAGKGDYVFLRAYSHAITGPPANFFELWAPEKPPAAGPPPNLWSMVWFTVVTDPETGVEVPTIFYQTNNGVWWKEETNFLGQVRRWEINMTWSGGVLTTYAWFWDYGDDTSDYSEATTYSTVGVWVFEVVRQSTIGS